MNEDRQLTIHFNNGTKIDLTFPIQIKNSAAAVLESIKKALESDKLVIEADGKLVIDQGKRFRQQQNNSM
jgi:hypothetical protein